ncbi:carboxypeptidase-like regulatory domain-containing protein [Terriglobus saanensis]|uniref:Cna B domain protein n=1 Tax=Terriglobus saanensis (strain ATCC BAA-1853 / DSM 23119 / SP1PR4) TaxID=401053 RepID=E8V1X4_TERSS|nr:carboxypeptidase-like regulatory domain-containing protein [Terriglobus saanensis]ADV83462.1 Cna B domain protein [Terriglobus saanensis SP1PR4]
MFHITEAKNYLPSRIPEDHLNKTKKLFLHRGRLNLRVPSSLDIRSLPEPRNEVRPKKVLRFNIMNCGTLCLFAIGCFVTTFSVAAQELSYASRELHLPDGPVPQNTTSVSISQSTTQGESALSGGVLDQTGAAVAGIDIHLEDATGEELRRSSTGTNGEFTFSNLPPGRYRVTVLPQKGFQGYASDALELSGQQAAAIPTIVLSVASAITEVTVRPTEEIAAEQIKAEEKQRLIGILPNYYVSFVHDAAPMTGAQKYGLALHEFLDPTRFVGTAIVAGVEQANNSYAGYGSNAAGYGKRYAAAYGDGLFQSMLSHAVFPALFHQDPRYFYQGTGSTKSRALHAISFALVVRDDSGRTAPNYSYLLGDVGAGLISNLYYPHADRGYGLVFTNALISLGGRAAGSLLHEFLDKHITKNVPKNSAP